MSAEVTQDHEKRQAGPARKLFINRDFGALWIGQSISMIGSSVSFIGLPLVAVLIIHVSPFQLGLIAAVERFPPVLAGPFAGPLADSYSRYRLMLIADIGRAVLLASIPVAVLLDDLRFWLLILVAFLTGVLTLFFNVAFQAYLPSLVASDRIGAGNARLGASQSASEVTGPGLAAGLIAAGGVALAIAADAASYAASAYFLGRIKVRDTHRVNSGDRPSRSRIFSRIRHDIKVGFTLLWQEDILRTVTRSSSILTFFAQMQAAVYFLFLIKDLHFSADMISGVFTAAGVIGLISAVWCNRLITKMGLGRLIILGQLILALGGALLALATGPVIVSSAFITAGEACFGIGFTLFSVGYNTLFQLRTADEVRGRVIGSSRFITTASIPLAAIFSGVLGSVAGLRTTLIAGAAGMAIGLAAILSPRVWNLRR